MKFLRMVREPDTGLCFAEWEHDGGGLHRAAVDDWGAIAAQEIMVRAQEVLDAWAEIAPTLPGNTAADRDSLIAAARAARVERLRQELALLESEA